MAGVCDAAFRLTVKEFGAGLIYTEMVSDKGLIYGNNKTTDMLFVDEREKPVSLQIFGGEADTLMRAAQLVQEKSNADIIDINMGCPVPKIVKSDAGAKLLLDPEKVHKIVKSVVDSVDLPVTVKIRTGWDEKNILAVENAQAIEAAGAAAVALHGRTRVQMYEGVANWDIIGEVKRSIKIPLIGNGDVKTPQDAKRMLEETGCDAVMIGRAALGNPWMMYQTVRYLETGNLVSEPSPREKVDVCALHLNRLIELKGERIAVREMRKHASWYLKGIKGNARVRSAINTANTKEELLTLLYGLVEVVEQ